MTTDPIPLQAARPKGDENTEALLPPLARRFLARARSEWAQQQFDAAERSATNALALAPENPDAIRILGLVVQRRGDHAKAIECFRRILAVWPEDPALKIGLALSLFENGEMDEATALLRQACKLAPNSASAWFNLGEALWRQGNPDESLPVLQRAIALDPAHNSARLSLARVQSSLGRVDDAITGFREVLRRAPDCADAWYGLSLNGARCNTQDVEHLQRAFARTDLPPKDHELLGFSLAKALEDRGDYAQAFDVLKLANASQRKHTKWNPAEEHDRTNAIIHAFADMPAPPPDARRGEEVILITSLPRSGSSLVEHILASHPDVEGANEIKDLRQTIEAESRQRDMEFPAWVHDATDADWKRLGDTYLARTARWRETKSRFTDKNLMNWRFTGAALAMLPAARIIVIRRDPVETCLGCFRQCFTEDAGFACDLDATADYYADFLRLTRFWLDKYPRHVFDLQYETLVADPARVVRDLLDFCGLPFDPACLQPHKTSRAVLTPSAAQVRQPLRRDTARSERYGSKLASLRQRLQDIGVIQV